MEQLTSQELTYLAHTARKCARDAEVEAAKGGGGHENHAYAARVYYELCAKCERLAKAGK